MTDMPRSYYRDPIYENENDALIQLRVQNPYIQNILDAWLKFGTVFLIYRLCTYFFLETDPNAQLFDTCSLKLVIFILLGFTLYYGLVDPLMPHYINPTILQNIFTDTIEFGTVLITSHVLDAYMSNGTYFDAEWGKTAILILISFAAYRIFVNPFIPTETTKPIFNDWAQFGTFLIVFRLLRGESIVDAEWILSVLFALLGFTGYHLITNKIISV